LRHLLIEAAEPAKIQREGKRLFLSGMMLMGDRENANARVYPSHVLQKGVDAIQHRINEGTMFSTLGHDSTSIVQPDKIAAVVKSLTRQGSNWYGTSEVIAEGMGKVLRSIIDAGGKLGHSSRSTANLRKNEQGIMEVQDPLVIHSIDIVANPSTQSDGIFNAIWESVAADSVAGHKLSKEDLHSKAHEIFVSLFTKLGHPELIDAQRKYGIDFSNTMGKYQRQIGEPGGEKTYLDNLEDDKELILKALLDLQQKIHGWNFQDLDGDKFSNAAKYLAAYGAKDPLKTASLKRENQRIAYTNSVIRETTRLLSRIGKRLHESPENFNVATNLRRRVQADNEANTTYDSAAKALTKKGYTKDQSPTAMNIHPSSVFVHPQHDDVFLHRSDSQSWEHHDQNPLNSFSTNAHHVGSHASLVNYLGQQKRP
jgi:hypothetical protein